MPRDDDFDINNDLDALSLDDFSLDDALSLSDEEAPPSGVWVKSAPEDMESAVLTNEPQGFSLEEPSEELSLDGFATDSLSTEELDKIGSDFDFVEASATPLEGEDPSEELDLAGLDSEITEPTGDFDDFSMDDLTMDSAPQVSGNFDEISLDDFVSFDDSVDPSGTGGLSSPQMDNEIPTEADSKEEYLDIDINIEDEVDDHELEIIEGAQVKVESTFKPQEVSGAEEIDLSDFTDVSFDSEISSVAVEDFSTSDISDIPEMSVPVQEDTLGSLGTELDDFALPDLDMPETAELNTDLEDGVFEEGSMEEDSVDEPLFALGDESDFSDDFESVLSQEKEQVFDIEIEPPEPDMESIHAIEKDLVSGIQTSAPPQNEQSRGAESILLKIEQELLSIKSEISNLKNQVSELKTAPDQGDSGSLNKGFFADDEDEVIALTGDELDNILSSAEVTEEDLVTTDDEGNVMAGLDLPEVEFAPGDESQSDVDLFAGTELEDTLEEDQHLPEEPMVTPIHGASSIHDNLPDDLDLEPLEEETQDFLGTSMELELEEDDLSLPMDTQGIEDVSFDDDEVSLDEPGSLEIPLDEDMLLDDELIEVPETEGTLPVDSEIIEPSQDFSFDNLETQDVVPSFQEQSAPDSPPASPSVSEPKAPVVLTDTLKEEIKAVLTYMDNLLENLPDDKIKEFADSEHFEVYRKLFEELGLTD